MPTPQTLNQLYSCACTAPNPLGVAPAVGRTDKRWQVYQGNTLKLYTCAPLLLSGDLATPDNSLITFTLVDDKYCNEPLYTAVWGDRLLPTSGGIEITIPHTVTEALREGNFRYSITVTNLLGTDVQTVEVGTIVVHYAPDSPNVVYPPN